MTHLHPSRAIERAASLRPTRLARALGLVLAAMSGSTLSYAQSAAVSGAGAAAASDGVETIVVTARKKLERLQEVPLAITAITARTLEDAGVKNTQDIVSLTPGLSMTSAGSEAQLNPVIRGVSNLNTAGDPTVAIFLDGMYLANSSAVSLGMIAMERVEVVKGPVSALYGRNAFGGAINYVSKRPGKELEGVVDLGISSYGGRTATASLNGTLVPGLLTARLTLGYDKSLGSWRDEVNGNRAGGYEKKDGMLSFGITPSTALSIDGAIYYGKDLFGQANFAVTDTNCGGVQAASTPIYGKTVLRQFCGEVKPLPLEVPTLNAAAGVAGNDREVTAANVRAAWDLGFMDAALLLGHNDVKQRRYNDFTGKRDGIPFQTLNPVGFNFQSVGLGNNGDSKDDQIELRLASKQTQSLRWQGGLNWFDGSSRAGTLVGTDTSKLAAGQTMVNSFLQNCYGSSTGGFGPCWGDARRTDKLTSPFAALEYDLASALTLSGEYRHTSQEKGQEILRNTSSPASPPPGLGSATGFQTKDFSFDNYRASMRWKMNADSMIYVSSANGTKAGGFNSAATVPEDLSYNPETSRTVELGGKFGFMGRKLQIGIALFTISTSDVQISGPSSNPANLGLVTKNFGSTQSQGIELDFAAAPAPGWKISGGIGYSDPKFKAGSYDFTISVADCQAIAMCASRQVAVNSPSGVKQALDLNGLSVPRTSNVTANLSLQYNGSVGKDWGWFGRSDLRYESKRYTTQTNWSWIPDRTLLNLRAGLENGNYRFTAFVNNATDSKVPDGALPSNRLNDSVPVIGATLPTRRTIGLTAGMNFL